MQGYKAAFWQGQVTNIDMPTLRLGHMSKAQEFASHVCHDAIQQGVQALQPNVTTPPHTDRLADQSSTNKPELRRGSSMTSLSETDKTGCFRV
jgi:hypothetical protein